jgi:Pentapeptide repeats (8 copies)
MITSEVMDKDAAHQHPRELRSLSLSLGLIVLAVATILAVVVFVPTFLYPPLGSHELNQPGLSGAERLSAQNNRLILQNNARTSIIQVIVGLAVLSGAIVGWRQLRHTMSDARAQRRSESESLLLNHFSKAVESIAADNLGVRLGGVYLLAMLAEKSLTHRGPVADVLSSFVRSRSPWPPSPPMPPIGTRPDQLAELSAYAPDIQGAVTVLGVYASLRDISVRLSGCDLRRANLAESYFELADFSGSQLAWASFRGARMAGASLRDANLVGAVLSDADLSGTNICGAELSDADLTGVRLNDAIFDQSTVWPTGFAAADAQRLGARREQMTAI